MIIRTVSLSLLLVFGCFGTPLDREIVKSEVAVHGYCPGMHAWCHHEEKCCASKHSICGYMCCPFHDGICCSEESNHCCRRHDRCTGNGCEGDHDITFLTHPFLKAIINKGNDIDKVKENNAIIIGELQQRKLDSIDDEADHYPTCEMGGLCTGNMCCPVKNKRGETISSTCCPYGDTAVCCETWCCEAGFTCGNSSLQTCIQGTFLPSELLPNKSLDTVSLDTTSQDKVSGSVFECPPGINHTCIETQTCCLSPERNFTCAPFPNATCCRDGVHSCPENYSCDNETNVCSPLIMDHVTETRSQVDDNFGTVVCDGEMECRDDQTCCRLSDGTFGCCPFPLAVCCSDHSHCCPHGWICNRKTKLCKKHSIKEAVMTLQKVLGAAVADQVNCNDGSVCPPSMTCCLLADTGIYGCCPFVNATCCANTNYCCPSHTTCNVKTSTCDGTQETMPMATKVPAMRSRGAVTQLADAVKSVLVNLPKSVPMLKKFPSTRPLLRKIVRKDRQDDITDRQDGLANVPCDDGSMCPDDSSCCLIPSGQFGCCPFKNAVCCDDQQHCCPDGFQCNTAAGSCDRKEVLSANTTKNIDTSVVSSITNLAVGITCQDGSTTCPNSSTCCQLSTGYWGCCPYPEAICCDDKYHCCPHGYTCNTKRGTCDPKTLDGTQTEDSSNLPLALSLISQSSELPISQTKDSPEYQAVPSSDLSMGSVVCPDESFCPSLSTCCVLESGDYGCCPYEDAVCCEDLRHCCPHEYTCNVKRSTCEYNRLQTDPSSNILVALIPITQSSELPDSQPLESEVMTSQQAMNTTSLSGGLTSLGGLTCDDGSICPTGTTCCLLASGEWGCCPYPEGVCCEDHIHCCPNGYTCDEGSSECRHHLNESSPKLPYSKLVERPPSQVEPELPETLSNLEEASDVSKTGYETFCKDAKWCTHTCCYDDTGSKTIGCCKFKNGVCCANGRTCCNAKEECDAQGRCHPSPANKLGNHCPDKSLCPGHTTCCKQDSSHYACCEYSNASCCSDGLHCCPNGYKCDLIKQRCVQESTGTFVKFVSVLSGARKPLCKDLTQCGIKGFCPSDMECLPLFSVCYSLKKPGYQSMILDCQE